MFINKLIMLNKNKGIYIYMCVCVFVSVCVYVCMRVHFCVSGEIICQVRKHIPLYTHSSAQSCTTL